MTPQPAIAVPADTMPAWIGGHTRKNNAPMTIPAKAVTIGTKREPPKKPRKAGSSMLW